MPVQVFYPNIVWPANALGKIAPGIGAMDAELVKRIKAAYRIAQLRFAGYGESWWASFEPSKAEFHQALNAEDDARASELLSNPGATRLYLGMDAALTCDYVEKMREGGRDIGSGQIQINCDTLLRLAEATGAVRLQYPEAEGSGRLAVEIEATLSSIEDRIGAKIDFPNPFAGEFGIDTSRGIATYRALQAIYQAWRLRALAETFGTKVVEIGGGTGRTAYYAHRFGLTDYTIIDLPLTSVGQAAFLGRTLGPDHVSLAGEDAKPGCVRLETPSWFLETSEQFDIVVNVDSLTEMDQQHARQYATVVAGAARALLSINHEHNGFRVADLEPLARTPRVRTPYWMRAGYVEELFYIAQPVARLDRLVLTSETSNANPEPVNRELPAEFICPVDVVTGIEVLLCTYQKRNSGYCQLDVLDETGRRLAWSRVDAALLRDVAYQSFAFNDLAGIRQRTLRLSLSYHTDPRSPGMIAALVPGASRPTFNFRVRGKNDPVAEFAAHQSPRIGRAKWWAPANWYSRSAQRRAAAAS